MAAWKYGCGFQKLLSTQGGRLGYLSKAVPSLGCSKVLRSTAVQNRFYSKTNVTCSHTKLPRKKRDRFTVLKALASTVEYQPGRADHRFLEDSILHPQIKSRQTTVLLAMESGSNAADYVMENFPHLFPLHEPVPAWPKQDTATRQQDAEASVDDFRLLIKSTKNTRKVLDWYMKLDSEGDLSLDVHNDMLDFVSFYANSVAEAAEDDNAEDVADDNNALKWKEGNFADTLFNRLRKNANAWTYEVYILGLLKHGQISKAFEMYNELKGKNLCGSLYLYNTLLSHVCLATDGDEERWNLAEGIAADMCQSNIKPDVVTFNSLMAVAAERAKNASTLCQQLLREMKSLNISPSLGSYYFLLQADLSHKNKYINKNNTINILRATLKDLKSGVVEFKLKCSADLKFFKMAAITARKGKEAEMAKELSDIVLNNKLIPMLGSNKEADIFFGQIMCSIASGGDVDFMFKEYRKLVPKVCKPLLWVVPSLLHCIVINKTPKYALEFYWDMVDQKITLRDENNLFFFSALEYNIPKEGCEDYLHVVEYAEQIMHMAGQKKTNLTQSVAINILCLCGYYKEAMERMEECKKLNLVPSVNAILSVFKLAIEKRDKEGALHLLKTMASYKTTRPQEREMILGMIRDNNFLTEESVIINSWFD